jgi:ABC-type sugar transport system substrate-binding protein
MPPDPTTDLAPREAQEKSQEENHREFCEMPKPTQRRLATAFLSLAVVAATGSAALAQKKYDTGASDTEIKIGNIVPYSGPASAYGVVGKAMAAVFKRVNDDGGINGRKINFISYDDAYSPPKAVEQARKLIESDEVLLLFGTLGTASNTAIQKYVNGKKVPQLFVATGATKWNDPKTFPWTMGWLPSYQSESRIYAKYLTKEKPNAKIAVLYQNDDMGKDYLKGLKDGLAADPSRIVAEESYEVAEPTIDSRRAAEVVQSRRHHLLHDAQIRRPGHQEARRDELEASHDRVQCQRLDRDRDAARRSGQFARRDVGGLRQGRQRSAVGRRSRHQGFRRPAGEVHAGGQSRRRLGDDRLQHGHDHGRSAEAVRRRPDPQQHHETGGQPQAIRPGRAVARHHAHHGPGRFSADRAIAVDAVQGRTLAIVRRRHQRRVGRQLTSLELQAEALPGELPKELSRELQ